MTFAVTLLSTPRVHWGVFVGVRLTMVSFLYRRVHPRIMEVGQHQDGTFRDRIRFNLPRLAPDVLAVRLDSALNFLTAAMLERYISKRIHADTHIRGVLLDAGSINDIDVSGIETLEALQRTLQDEGIVLGSGANSNGAREFMIFDALIKQQALHFKQQAQLRP